MNFIITLIRILFAVYAFAFAGTAIGGLAGLMLVGLDLLEFHHILWLMEAGAALFVVWGFSASGNGGSIELSETRKPKTRAVELFDDNVFIEGYVSCGIWHASGDMWHD